MIPSSQTTQTTLGDILVVDDSHASRQALVTLLKNVGYSVREAPNGELALWSMAKHAPDLVMLDVRMPGMSGFDVCRSIRQQSNTATVPVIFITDVADMDDTLEGFDAGGTDFISKPISDVETLARVRTHIHMAQAAKKLLEQHTLANGTQPTQPTAMVDDTAHPAEILVVEDTPISLLLLGTILRMAGYVVREATNGELALWSATKRAPDLILLDIRMPGMNGFDVCRCLKFDPATAHIPVIFISALTDAQDKAAGFAVGAVDFIAKPFDGKEVLARVQAHLRLARTSTPAKGTLAPSIAQNQAEGARPQTAAQTTEFDKAFAASVNAIALTDAKGCILALNPAFSQLTGYPIEDVRSTPLMDLLARHAKSPLANTWPDLRKQGSWSTQARLLKRDQSYIACQMSMSALQDFDGHTDSCVVVLQDISLKPPQESLIDFLAHFDPHTGLPNRALAQSRFAAMQSTLTAGEKIAVCVIRLSLPPDTLAISDLPQKIAARLAPLLDATDTLYRDDQQHFVLLHPQTGESNGDVERAVRIADQINTDTHWPEKPPGLRASIGLAFAPQDGDTLAALVEAGKTSIEHAAPGSSVIGASVVQHPDFDIACALRSALARHEFRLLYQPLLALPSRSAQARIVGAEALLRWKVPDLGYIPLARLLQTAEETGEIIAIGAWVIRSVCAQVKLWEPQLANGFKVAINISSLQFWQDGLFATIEEALRDSGIAPARLEFDITEDTILEDETQATAILRRLKMLGVSLALDGFSPSRTDPDLLQSLPLDCLKVDQQKIGAMDADPGHAGLLESIVELAHTLQLQAVAKGVERPEELQQIRDCHFDLAQGFLLARPIAADAFSPKYLC